MHVTVGFFEAGYTCFAGKSVSAVQTQVITVHNSAKPHSTHCTQTNLLTTTQGCPSSEACGLRKALQLLHNASFKNPILKSAGNQGPPTIALMAPSNMSRETACLQSSVEADQCTNAVENANKVLGLCS